MSNALKAVLPPAALEGAQLKSTTDRQADLSTVRVADHIVSSVFTQLPFAPHGSIETRAVGFNLVYIGGVHKYKPWRFCRRQFDRDVLTRQCDDISDLERDTPGDAIANRCVYTGSCQLFRYPQLG
jgi:hypothetical protein